MRMLKGIVVVWMAVFLYSCQEAPQVEYNGVPLTSEEIRALGESVKAQESETLPQTEAETEQETKEPADGIVFWTAGGEVWHEWQDCYRISKKNPVLTGSIEEAMAANKDRGCSSCCEQTEEEK